MAMIQTPKNKALLVIVKKEHHSAFAVRENFEELKELSESALIKVLNTIQTNRLNPSPRYFIREGKLEEIKLEAKKLGANVLIFNVDLSPAQARNIETFTKVPAMDRTGLILEIFGRRAKSKEGKLQVELARLNYMLPRLGGLGTVMSRLGGGIGSRGPGEQELEHDRRKFRIRIQRVKEELKKVEKHRKLLREGRKKKNFLTAAIVGYTNAGKSSLLNALTGSETYIEDKMFATLDPLTRMQSVNGGKDILFIDTVGFLRDLPHDLIESFHATLEEVLDADFLIHVLDVSNPKFEQNKKDVEKVLKEIGAGGQPIILALNKTDLLDEEKKQLIQHLWPESVLISAIKKEGLEQLMNQIKELNFNYLEL